MKYIGLGLLICVALVGALHVGSANAGIEMSSPAPDGLASGGTTRWSADTAALFPAATNTYSLGKTSAVITRVFTSGLKDANDNDRLIIGAGSFNQYRSNLADGASIIAHRTGSFITLDDAGAKIECWYSDNISTARVCISVEGGLRVNASNAAKPTCSATYRGQIWFAEGGAGVADTFEVCSKDAADNYAWAALF